MRTITAIIVFSTIAFSCNSNKNDYYGDTSLDRKEMEEMLQSPETRQTSHPSIDTETYERKIIKTASLQFEVTDNRKALSDIKSIVSECNGYISEENEETSGNKHTIYLTIRVPNQAFDSLIELLTYDRPHVDFKRISSEDVSEEYYDIVTRLENEKEIEKRYLELLDKAVSVQDILEIERELGNIRTEIESKEGRIKRLENRIAYSTVNLCFYQYVDYKFVPETRYSFIERIKKSVYSGWRGLVNFTVFLFNIWPLIIILIIVGYFIRKRIKKKQT